MRTYAIFLILAALTIYACDNDASPGEAPSLPEVAPSSSDSSQVADNCRAALAADSAIDASDDIAADREYDRFEDITLFRVGVRMDRNSFFAAGYALHGEGTGGDLVEDDFMLGWEFITEGGWEYLGDHRTIVIIDDERFNLESSRTGEQNLGGDYTTTENIASLVHYDKALEMLSGAESIEWRVGSTEGELGELETLAVRQFTCEVLEV